MTSPVNWRRAAAGALAALAAGGAVAGSSALAAGNGASTPTVTSPTSKGGSAPVSTPPGGMTKVRGMGGPSGSNPVFTAAVARLQQSGTIDQAQAQAIDAQLSSGSLDLQQLVTAGTITAAQMQIVNNAFIQAKMSLATDAGPNNGQKGATCSETTDQRRAAHRRR